MGHYASEMSSTWDSTPPKWVKHGFDATIMLSSDTVLKCKKCWCLVDADDWEKHRKVCK